MLKLSLPGVLLLGLSVWGQLLVNPNDGASHIVIVTPQSQVHLEPLSANHIHHLSPYLRFIAPGQQEEAIVFVPSSGMGPLAPVQNAGPSSANARQGTTQIQQCIQDAQQAIAGAGPAFSEAAAAAAASAGSSFFPGFFPPPASKIQADAAKPLAMPPLAMPLENQQAQLSAVQARGGRYLAIASTVPQWLDVVGSLRARSIQDLDAPIALGPTEGDAAKPEALPLKTQLPDGQITETKPLLAEKKSDFSRFLEANALKEEQKPAAALLQEKENIEDPKKAAGLELPPNNVLLEAKSELPLPSIYTEQSTGLKKDELRTVGVVDEHHDLPLQGVLPEGGVQSSEVVHEQAAGVHPLPAAVAL